MFYQLYQWLVSDFNFLNIFSYITVRTIFAALTSFFISIIFGNKVISFLRNKQLGQVIRDDGPSSHLKKEGTPTMGGVLIIFAIVITTLLWADLSNIYILICLFVTISFGGIGFLDDYKKVIKNNSKGLSAKKKYIFQAIISIIVGTFLYYIADTQVETSLIFPIMKDLILPLGLFFIFWVVFILTGTSNAVNLTDGLDGLAIFPTVLVASGLGIYAYITGNYNFSEYLYLPFIPGTGEISIICGAIVGAGLGFLWFNAPPALIFMGDVGSLALGALLGVIAIIIRQEIVLAIMGGIFVIETISVIIQVTSFKLRKKRVFKMAPIHHHFELLNETPETRVTIRFWIVSIALVLIGLALLKLR